MLPAPREPATRALALRRAGGGAQLRSDAVPLVDAFDFSDNQVGPEAGRRSSQSRGGPAL
jgi:hypothetical protein